ncbi:MAG: Na/Pi cotransporter family protein [Verrucomicrobiaceae bacterium]
MVTALQILGALGIFLFGMKVMSEGVQKFAGARMRAALASITGNRFKGVLTGVFTTGLVQSSSATTVLVVSFVNVGLLTLVESIGVIMGANLGTTLTAWIVATIGKFSVAKIAIPIIGLGFPVFFIGKGRAKAFGEFMVGFGLLFLGLGELKDAVPDLSGALKDGDQATANSMQYWIGLLGNKGYLSYVLFMIAGVILTLIVQSSSAAMAITITCAINGWFGTNEMEVFKISAAIVLGENIGTTVTAWLASLGATTDAKRAARAHFTFNVVGVIWMLILFVPFTAMVWNIAQHLPESMKSAKKEWGASEIAFATAIFHTSFNLLNILMLVWFVPQIANLVQKWVPDKKETASPRNTNRLRYISQKFVDLGELNIVEAEGAIRKMSKHTHEMYKGFIDAFDNPTTDLSSEISRLKKMEDEADLMMQDITEYLVQCAARDVTPEHAGNIAAMILIVSELEECTDCIYRLVKLIERKYNKGHQFTDHQAKRFHEISDVVGQALGAVDNYLLQPVPADVISSVKSLEDQTDNMRKSFNKEAIKRMAEGDIRVEMLYTDINNQLEAMANHALKIMEASNTASIRRN